MYAGINKGFWRRSYDAKEVLMQTARDLQAEILVLGLDKPSAWTVISRAAQILNQDCIGLAKSVVADMVTALEQGNDTAKIKAIWLADIYADYAIQRQGAAMKIAA